MRELGGERFTDDYFWLREKGKPEVEAYLEAEHAYAMTALEPLSGLTERLYREIVSHIAEDDESVPVKDGEWWYGRRIAKGQSYPVFFRRKGGPSGPEAIVLDQNALAEGKAFLGLGALDVSDDGSWLLYATDETGFRQHTLRFKDLRSGETSPERIEKVVVATWAADGRTVFYVVEDEAKRPYRLFRHVVGADPANDALVYEEKDERFEVRVSRTQSRAFVVVTTESQLTAEVRLIDARRPESAPILVEPRGAETKYFVEHRGDRLYLRVNDRGRNYRLVTAPVKSPGRKSWTELRAHDDAVMIEGQVVFDDHYVLELRAGGQPQLEVYDFRAKTTSRVAMPEADYAVWLGAGLNLEPNTRKVRYEYQSLSTPRSVYEYDVDQKTSTLLEEQPVPGGFDRRRYVTELLSATAADGTAIPISIVRRRDVPVDGSAPLHLEGYGAYGYAFDPEFSAPLLALLDRGVIYAIAHVRGGGEYGKRWHEEGRMAKKMNTFTDFIACAEHLVRARYTTPARLTIEGVSAGGLLMGAVLNLRPDLFKAALVKVPFVDVVNTMNDPTLPLTVTEYEEWGNPQIPEQYGWLRAYSPYDNVDAKAYPAMLVRTSYNDSQVMYFEPAKWVARLRAKKTDSNPLLFTVHMDPAGHGGKSGRYERYRDVALEYAFLLGQMGLAER